MRRFFNFKQFLGLSLLVGLLVPFQNCSEFDGQSRAPQGDFLIVSGVNSDGDLVDEEIQYKIEDGDITVQGDIIVGEHELLLEGNRFAAGPGLQMIPVDPDADVTTSGVYKKSALWPRGDLYFSIHSDMPAARVSRIRQAADELNDLFDAEGIGIDIYEMPVSSVSEQNFVLIRPGTGCSASLGFAEGKRSMTLASGCSLGSVKHEFLHNLGALHEHTRFDRDDFITVEFDKIRAGKEHNFRKSEILSNDVGDYDFSSVMHYSSRGFSTDGSNTINVKPEYSAFANVLGNRTGLSDGDIASLRSVYPNDGITNPPGTSPSAANPTMNFDIPLPLDPTVSLVTQTSTMFKVSWSDPGEGVVTHMWLYEILDDDGLEKEFLSYQKVEPGETREATFDDLQSNKTYQVSFNARNAAGTGLAKFNITLANRGPSSLAGNVGEIFVADGTPFKILSESPLSFCRVKNWTGIDKSAMVPQPADLQPLRGDDYNNYCDTTRSIASQGSSGGNVGEIFVADGTPFKILSESPLSFCRVKNWTGIDKSAMVPQPTDLQPLRGDDYSNLCK